MSFYDGNAYEGFSEYMRYGELPTVCLEKYEVQKQLVLNRLFKEIYLKDIENRYIVRNTGEIDDILDFLSSNIGFN